jgi:hypothetical protein
VKVTKYEIETATIVVNIEKLAQPDGRETQWIAGARSTDLKRNRPTVFGGSAREAGAKLAAALREMAAAIDEGIAEGIS